MKNKELYGSIFSYNCFTDRWMATNRDNYFKLWNEGLKEEVLESRSINSLQELIIKGKGDLRTILKLKEAI